MADMLIRDVPDDVVAAIDAQALRLGLVAKCLRTPSAGRKRRPVPIGPSEFVTLPVAPACDPQRPR